MALFCEMVYYSQFNGSEIPTVQKQYPNVLTWPLSACKKRGTQGMFQEVLVAESHA